MADYRVQEREEFQGVETEKVVEITYKRLSYKKVKRV